MERAPDHPEPGHRRDGGGPVSAVAYVAASVTDLEEVRQYFTGAFGMTEIRADAIHAPEHESLWGLAGARRECAVFALGEVLIEVVRYESPAPRPPALDSLLSDQGIMNVAIGYRECDELVRALDRATAVGASATTEPPSSSGSVYLRTADRLSVELLLVPAEYDDLYGFRPRELPPGDVVTTG
jgi:catechol 2,3-dioxygenase-like lactoylglutathione lyase family enzyme